MKLDETLTKLTALADDYEAMANEIKIKREDCNALVMLDGVVIGMRRCINELRPQRKRKERDDPER